MSNQDYEQARQATDFRFPGESSFVLVMSRVWGRPATDSPIGTSYTEEEFKRAAARFNATGTPEIVCFFKQVPLDVLADPGPQLQQVLRFKQSIEDWNQVLYLA